MEYVLRVVQFDEIQDERWVRLSFGLYAKMSKLIKVTFLIFDGFLFLDFMLRCQHGYVLRLLQFDKIQWPIFGLRVEIFKLTKVPCLIFGLGVKISKSSKVKFLILWFMLKCKIKNEKKSMAFAFYVEMLTSMSN